MLFVFFARHSIAGGKKRGGEFAHTIWRRGRGV